MTDPFDIPSPGIPLAYGDTGSPLVVLLHDEYGRLAGLESYAQTLARVGFRVIVPDLFDGVATTDTRVSESLLEEFDVAHGLAVVDDAILDAHAEGSRRVGVVGFSMGGWLALLHAQGGATDAVVCYYATLTAAEHGIVPCPVLLNFAEQDDWGEGADPESFIDRLKDHGTPVNDHSYLGTVHSFANGDIPSAFHSDAAALALARTASFLEDQLGD